MNPQQMIFLGHDRVEAMKDEARRSRLLADNRAPGDDFEWRTPRRPSLAVRIGGLIHAVRARRASTPRQPRPAIAARTARQA